MASTSHDQHVSTQAAIAGQVETRSDPRGGRIRPWVNWTLALLTVPAAVVVVLVGLGVFMSYAACSAQACPTQGPSGIWLEIVWFGSAVVAAVTVCRHVLYGAAPIRFCGPSMRLGTDSRRCRATHLLRAALTRGN